MSSQRTVIGRLHTTQLTSVAMIETHILTILSPVPPHERKDVQSGRCSPRESMNGVQATMGRCADVLGCQQVIAGAFHVAQDEAYDAHHIPRLEISPYHHPPLPPLSFLRAAFLPMMPDQIK
jgi:hypothetical protein